LHAAKQLLQTFPSRSTPGVRAQPGGEFVLTSGGRNASGAWRRG